MNMSSLHDSVTAKELAGRQHLKRMTGLLGSRTLLSVCFCMVFFGFAARAAAKAAPGRIQAASELQAPTQRVYLVADVLKLLAKRGEGRPLYFIENDTMVRARYLADGPQLLLDIIQTPSNVADRSVHELSPSDPIVTTMLSGEFEAWLTIVVHGSAFADDPMDQYSPINQSIQIGMQISPEGREKCKTYMQIIGKILDAQ